MAEEEPEEGLTRRSFMKGIVAAGAVGVGASVIATGSSLLPPKATCPGTLDESIVYQKVPQDAWFNSKADQEVSVADFETWKGASCTWRRRLGSSGQVNPRSGLSLIVIKLPPSDVSVPEDPPLPSEFTQDPGARTQGFWAFYDMCVHLCCSPGWQLIPVPDGWKDYDTPVMTKKFGYDPMLCICHGSQYDPLQIVWDKHPNGQRYVGARRVHGPADRALPAVPLQIQGGRIKGIWSESLRPWYDSYCGGLVCD